MGVHITQHILHKCMLRMLVSPLFCFSLFSGLCSLVMQTLFFLLLSLCLSLSLFLRVNVTLCASNKTKVNNNNISSTFTHAKHIILNRMLARNNRKQTAHKVNTSPLLNGCSGPSSGEGCACVHFKSMGCLVSYSRLRKEKTHTYTHIVKSPLRCFS